MRLPRDLNGRQLAHTLIRHFGYREVNRAGSHIILQIDSPKHHRVSVPDHDPLRIGTLNAILRSVAEAKGIGRSEILSRI